MNKESMDFFNNLVSILRIHPPDQPPRPIGSGFFLSHKESIYFILTLHNFKDIGINKNEIINNKNNLFISIPMQNLEINPEYFYGIFYPKKTHEDSGAALDENDFIVIKIHDALPTQIKDNLRYFGTAFNFEELILEIISKEYTGNYCIGFPLEHSNYDYDCDFETKSVKLQAGLEVIQGIIKKDDENHNLFSLTNIKYKKDNSEIRNNLSKHLNGFSGSPIFAIINEKDFVLFGMLLRANGTAIFIKHIIDFIDNTVNKISILNCKITPDINIEFRFSEIN
ncbi:MAG: hypothetical protein KHW43_01095 [Neisseria sp.]|nr:hypothetical protein [Neisseria sp.]